MLPRIFNALENRYSTILIEMNNTASRNLENLLSRFIYLSFFIEIHSTAKDSAIQKIFLNEMNTGIKRLIEKLLGDWVTQNTAAVQEKFELSLNDIHIPTMKTKVLAYHARDQTQNVEQDKVAELLANTLSNAQLTHQDASVMEKNSVKKTIRHLLKKADKISMHLRKLVAEIDNSILGNSHNASDSLILSIEQQALYHQSTTKQLLNDTIQCAELRMKQAHYPACMEAIKQKKTLILISLLIPEECYAELADLLKESEALSNKLTADSSTGIQHDLASLKELQITIQQHMDSLTLTSSTQVKAVVRINSLHNQIVYIPRTVSEKYGPEDAAYVPACGVKFSKPSCPTSSILKAMPAMQGDSDQVAKKPRLGERTVSLAYSTI